MSGIAVTANATTTVAHQLGRPIKGRILTSYTFASGTDEGVIHVGTLPSGRDSNLYFAFIAKFTGTVDLLFF